MKIHCAKPLIFIGGALLACFALAQSNLLNVARTVKMPSGPEDTAWNAVKASKTILIGVGELAGKTLEVEMKALHDGQDIALYFRWPDKAPSLTRNAWGFDGTAWKHLGGDEDRLALAFPIKSVPLFTTAGCAGMCHTVGKDTYMATNAEGEKLDLWHWKAYTTNALNYADNYTIGQKPNDPNAEGGLVADSGNGGSKANQTADGSKPMYMQDPSKTPPAPGILLDEQKIEIKDYSAFKSGDVIPRLMSVRPSGDRAFIWAHGVWKEGYWTLMLKRKLNTASANDVVFVPGEAVAMGVAVFDNTGDGDKYAVLGSSINLRLGR